MRVPAWATITAAVLGVLGILFFFQTKDPMLLVFAVMAAAMVVLVALLLGLASGSAASGGMGSVKVRCRACQALSPEDAKHCMHCGQPL